MLYYNIKIGKTTKISLFLGFWIKTKTHTETPDISFQYKYLLLMERGIEMTPIVCSTFTTYKENDIPDDCLIIKVFFLMFFNSSTLYTLYYLRINIYF